MFEFLMLLAFLTFPLTQLLPKKPEPMAVRVRSKK